MKGIVVYIKVTPYLQEYLTFCFGNPVKLPRRSYENVLLSSLLGKKRNNEHPLSAKMDGLAVVIPHRSNRRPEFYNYLSKNHAHIFVRALKDIFKVHLWSDVFPLVNSGAGLNESIDTWCKTHGISIDNREAVRQCFFRLRHNHEQYGIVLGKKYSKSLPL